MADLENLGGADLAAVRRTPSAAAEVYRTLSARGAAALIQALARSMETPATSPTEIVPRSIAATSDSTDITAEVGTMAIGHGAATAIATAITAVGAAGVGAIRSRLWLGGYGWWYPGYYDYGYYPYDYYGDNYAYADNAVPQRLYGSRTAAAEQSNGRRGPRQRISRRGHSKLPRWQLSKCDAHGGACDRRFAARRRGP